MKVIRSIKFGKRIVITLDGMLLNRFRNHTAVIIDEIYFNDAIVLMTSESDSRNSLSIENTSDINDVSVFEGKPIIFI